MQFDNITFKQEFAAPMKLINQLNISYCIPALSERSAEYCIETIKKPKVTFRLFMFLLIWFAAKERSSYPNTDSIHKVSSSSSSSSSDSDKKRYRS